MNEYLAIKDQEGFNNEFIVLKNEGKFERMCCANYKTKKCVCEDKIFLVRPDAY